MPPDPGAPFDVDFPGEPSPLGLTLSSLGGVQLKLSMSWRGERLRLAARAGDADWIVNFPAAHWPGLVANEAAIMDWGRRAGFLEEHWARTPLLEPLRERSTSRPSR